jgi:serine/threonine protein kinase
LKAKVDLKELFPGSPPLALDLIDKLLNLNPNERIEIEEALRHPFLEMLHDPEDEPVFEGTIDFGFESDPNLDLDSIMRLIFK